MACFFAFSITIGVSPVTMQIAVAQETKQVLYPERGYWRIIDKTGKFVFEKRFERQPDIQEKDMLAAEYSPSNRYESDLHYFSYDFSGKRLRALFSGPESPCWEDGTYSEGLTSFKADGFFGYLDENGKVVWPSKMAPEMGGMIDNLPATGLASDLTPEEEAALMESNPGGDASLEPAETNGNVPWDTSVGAPLTDPATAIEDPVQPPTEETDAEADAKAVMPSGK
jgi:hypothetical protein